MTKRYFSNKIESYLLSETCRFILINAFHGYGKTYLLRELFENYDKFNDTCCFFVDLEKTCNIATQRIDFLSKLIFTIRKEGFSFENENDCLCDILKYIENNKKNQIIILIDSCSEAYNDIFCFLKTEFTNYFFRKHIRIKIIVSFDFIKNNNYFFENPSKQKVLSLNPLSFRDIHHIVREHIGKSSDILLPQSVQENVSAKLFFLTGGYPALVTEIFDRIRLNLEKIDLSLSCKESKEKCSDKIMVISKEIKKSFTDKFPNITDDIFYIFGVFRYIEKNILEEKNNKMDHKLFSSIVDHLTFIDIIEINNSLYLNNKIRGILSLYLRERDGERFRELCEDTKDLCLKKIDICKQTDSSIWVIEYLFQSLQYISIESDIIQENFKEKNKYIKIFEIEFQKILDIYFEATHRNCKAKEWLRDSIDKDEEFCFLFNYLFRDYDSYNEDPVNRLKEKLFGFFEEKQIDENGPLQIKNSAEKDMSRDNIKKYLFFLYVTIILLLSNYMHTQTVFQFGQFFSILETHPVTLAFIFGSCIILILLSSIFFFPKPTTFQYTVIRIILSLAAAGVASVIPGMIKLDMQANAIIMIRAGGAIAVFLVVYLLAPAKLDNK